MPQETGRFSSQDVLSVNTPVRTQQSDTACSHSRSPSLFVCPHSFIHPKVSLSFFFGCWFMLISDQIRPTIGLLYQRHSYALLLTGTGSPCCASVCAWHQPPRVAFIANWQTREIHVHKIILLLFTLRSWLLSVSFSLSSPTEYQFCEIFALLGVYG